MLRLVKVELPDGPPRGTTAQQADCEVAIEALESFLSYRDVACFKPLEREVGRGPIALVSLPGWNRTRRLTDECMRLAASLQRQQSAASRPTPNFAELTVARSSASSSRLHTAQVQQGRLPQRSFMRNVSHCRGDDVHRFAPGASPASASSVSAVLTLCCVTLLTQTSRRIWYPTVQDAETPETFNQSRACSFHHSATIDDVRDTARMLNFISSWAHRKSRDQLYNTVEATLADLRSLVQLTPSSESDMPFTPLVYAYHKEEKLHHVRGILHRFNVVPGADFAAADPQLEP